MGEAACVVARQAKMAAEKGEAEKALTLAQVAEALSRTATNLLPLF